MIPLHHHRIWYFPVMGVKRGVGAGDGVCMFLKKGGEKERGLMNLSALCLSNKKAYHFEKSIRSFIQTSRDQDPDRPL